MDSSLTPSNGSRQGRNAGCLYLVMAVFSAFSMAYVDPKLHVPGDAAATLANFKTFPWLFRLGFVSNLAGQVVFLFLVHALYDLLRPVHRVRARLMVLLVVASVPIACLNMLNQFVPVLLMGGGAHLAAFTPGQLQALALVFLDLQKLGIFIAEIFWGLWLFPFGLLVFRSGFFPKALGILLLLGGAGYLVESLVNFLFPGHEILAYPAIAVAALAELSMILWLLFKGAQSVPAKGARGQASA